MRDRLDMRARPHQHRPHKARELAERSLVGGLVRKNLALDDYLGGRRNHQIDGRRFHQVDGRALESTRKTNLFRAIHEVGHGREMDRGLGRDHPRYRRGLALIEVRMNASKPCRPGERLMTTLWS